jgi:hypothetical protein
MRGESIKELEIIFVIKYQTRLINKAFNIHFCNLDCSPIFRVTYTRGCIDKIDSPDDEQEVARNM